MEAIVEYNYAAKEPDELTLRKGDVIKDIKVMPGGWWEGTLKDKRGMFPDNFVKIVDASLTTTTASATSSATKSETTEVSSTIGKKEQVTMRNGSSSGNKWCKVLFSYEPCNEDELALVPNDMIEFLGEVEEGWWSGKLGGRVGVFPSNFVSPPSALNGEECEVKVKERERETPKELCRVLFPYEAANEDELTLVEGDIITIVSRDAPDKGWWKGELRGKVGLFPDNFVKIVAPEDESPTLDDMKSSSGLKDTTKTSSKTASTTKTSTISSTSSLSLSSASKKVEKAGVRRSLDIRPLSSADQKISVVTPEKKSAVTSTTSPISSSSVSSMILNSEKKIAMGVASNNSTMSLSMAMNLKRATKNTADESNIGSNENIYGSVDEELDGVEREEYTPLLHLTATRVKAPRRRLPSSHCLRSQTSFNSSTSIGNSALLQDNSVLNGTTDTVDQSRDDESESILGKTRQKAPWIKELKLNQMEKKKTLATDKFDKLDIGVKKEKNYAHEQLAYSVTEICADQNQDNDIIEIRAKEKDKDNSSTSTYQRINLSHASPVSPTTSPGGSAYVPYRLYCQLLDRVALLEERQTALQRTVSQLTEQIGPLLANASVISNKP